MEEPAEKHVATLEAAVAQATNDETMRVQDSELREELRRRFGDKGAVIVEEDRIGPDLQLSAGFCIVPPRVTINSVTQWGGVVDGNGPSEYFASVRCRNGSLAFGVTRWCGDQRGSIATCAGGISGERKLIIILTP